MKKLKNNDEQVKYVEAKKNIYFADEDIKNFAKQLFKMYNYANIINPYKIYFITGYNSDTGHEYLNKVNFQEYVDYFGYDKTATMQLLEICYELETIFFNSINTNNSFNITKRN